MKGETRTPEFLANVSANGRIPVLQAGDRFNIATLRFWMRWHGLDRLTDLQRSQMPVKRKLGNEALQLMDQHLAGREWFIGDAISLADICLFAYTHVADEADFDLALYPNVIEWMERIMTQPGHVPMDA
jgi:glutathione S-transferase